MRTILTLSAVVILAAACAPRPHPHSMGEAPYLLHVPAPGTDYRHRSGPQGFGRTGPAYGPAPHGSAHHGYPGPSQGQPLPPDYPPHGYGPYGAGPGPEPYGREGGYAWGERRGYVRGGHAYESREMMTEETWIGGGVILEREGRREPHRPDPIPHEAAPGYPGPYALAPRHPAPEPHRPRPRQPWPDAGPEPFY